MGVDSITLGNLRQYLQDHAYDASDLKANRLLNYWINEGLARIYRAHDWSWFKCYDRLVLDTTVAGTDLVVTQGSRTVTSASAPFTPIMATTDWHILVTAAPYSFKVANYVSATEIVLDTEFAGASATGVTFTLVHNSYPIPGGRILMVEDVTDGRPLTEIPVWEFDRLKSLTRSQTSNDAVFFTIRKDRIELWQYPGTARGSVGFTYSRYPCTYKVGDDDTTVVDWPGHAVSLLRAAGVLEASEHLGKSAVVPLGVSHNKFDTLLRQFIADDVKLADTESKSLSLTGRRGSFRSVKHVVQTKTGTTMS